MDARTVARLLALGRAALGVGLMAAPERVGARWIGDASRRPGAQVAIAAVGARDVALGLGTAWAVGGGEAARPWLLGAIVADSTDLLATLRHRDAMSTGALVGVGLLAGGSAVLGAWLQSAID